MPNSATTRNDAETNSTEDIHISGSLIGHMLIYTPYMLARTAPLLLTAVDAPEPFTTIILRSNEQGVANGILLIIQQKTSVATWYNTWHRTLKEMQRETNLPSSIRHKEN